INFPSAMSGPEPSCKDQHALYDLEKIRVSALAAQLGEEAKQCHNLHGTYDAAVSAAEAQRQRNAACVDSIQQWEQATKLFALNGDCTKYLQAKKEYDALVKKIASENTTKRNVWLKSKSDAIEYNRKQAQAYAVQLAAYKLALAAWETKNAAYNSYRYSIIAQINSLDATWKNTLSRTPALKDYQFTYVTNRCGARMRCMTQAEKTRLLSGQCVVLKGLGATTKYADICKTAHYYPTCPTTACKTPVAHPGTAPTAPSSPGLRSYGAEPAYTSIPTWESFRDGRGLPGTLEGCSPTKYPNPGGKPGCNPNTPIPGIPSKPTCTPPEIPAMPVEPTCKLTSTSQMGAMWVVLALGAGGLYWYSKKK